MKNIKIFLYIVVSLFIPLAGAVDVDLGGQHRMRGVYASPEGATQGNADMFIQRFKLSGSFRPNEMFESHFWLMTNHKWGNAEYNNSTVRIYGYGDWKALDEVILRLGRAPLQITDGASVGENDYENYPYIWDGAFLTYNTESVIVDVWGAYLPNVWSGQQEVQKYTSAVGGSLNVRSLPDFFKTVNLFVVHTLGTQATSDHIRGGLSVGGNASGADYKVSTAVHGVDFSSMNQYFVDAQAGYTAANARVYVAGHYESEAFDPYYYTRHNSAGLLDIATWGNGTQYAQVGFSYVPMDDFEVGAAGLYFMSVGQFGLWHRPSYTLATENVYEIDVHLKKAYAGGFAIGVSTGVFDPMGNSPYWQVQMNTSFDF